MRRQGEVHDTRPGQTKPELASGSAVKGGSSRGHIAQSASKHFQLLDLLAKRDEPGAVALMRRHREKSRQVWREDGNQLQA